jgi:AraC family transcriptional regulator, regulatory protein of adaptative response / DNA-3-methyladenine glycosylase II
VLEDIVTPNGPYRLHLIVRGGRWTAALPAGDAATACQRGDGRVVIRAATEAGLERARAMLALDDDTGEFHRRFARDPLIGPSARALVGYRPLRLATVAHATLRAIAGQLIESSRARAIERSVLRACGEQVVTQEHLARFSPAQLRRLGLATHRASTLVRLARTIDLERLREHPTDVVLARLTRERGIGPWSVGVIALEGLGRYDHGLVGDLGLVKLASALWRRAADGSETAELLAPYGEWQGLAGEILMRGWGLGLVPGANPDAGRMARVRARRAA